MTKKRICRPILVLLAAFFLIGSVVTTMLNAASAVRAASGASGITRVGQLPLDPCHSAGDHLIAVDGGLHALLDVRSVGAFGTPCAPVQSAGAYVAAFSTASFDVLGQAKLNIPLYSVYGVDHISVDPIRHRLYLTYLGASGEQLVGFDVMPLLAHATVLQPFFDVVIPPPPPSTGFSTTDPGGGVLPPVVGATGVQYLNPSGLSDDSGSNSLLLVESENGTSASSSTHGPVAEPVYVFQFDASTGTMQWAQFLAACAYGLPVGVVPNVPVPPPALRVHDGATDVVAVGCLFDRGQATPPQVTSGTPLSALTGGSSLTYVIPLDSHGLPVGASPTSQGASTYYIGRSGVTYGVADPASGRIFYATIAQFGASQSTRPSPTAVAFDVRRRVYVGAATAASPLAGQDSFPAVLAAGGGSLYSFGLGGVIDLADTAATPLGQGVSFPSYSCFSYQAAVDGALRRIFVQPYNDCTSSPNNAYEPVPLLLAYQDDTQAATGAAAADPDSYTSQIPETAGQTIAQFNGHSAATGTRLRVIGGSSGFLTGATFGAYDIVGALGVAPPGDSNTREVDLGQIPGAALDSFQASAQASAADADHETQTQTSTQWPFVEDSCSDPGKTSAAQQYGADTSSQVTCSQPNQQVSATAQAGAMGFAISEAAGSGQAVGQLPVSVGQSYSHTTVTRDAKTGVVVDSYSAAKGIDIGVVQIRSVEAEAICSAHGHARSALCTYTRTVSGATAGGAPLGSGGCISRDSPGGTVDTCGAILSALNAIQPGLLIFSMPSPDQRPNYLDGSPGGYQAVAQRELYESLQDQTLNYDGSLQVPGFEMLYNNDTPTSPSRLDMQLASVQAESHYGIQPVQTVLSSGPPAGNSGGGTTNAGGPPTQAGSLSGASVAPVQSGVVGASGFGPGIVQALERLWDGLLAIVRSPITGLIVLSLLGVLFTPLLMAWRRRVLLVALSRQLAR